MTETSTPANGTSVTVRIPGAKRDAEFVVISGSAIPDSFIGGKPSRKHPGDFTSHRTILTEWIVR